MRRPDRIQPRHPDTADAPQQERALPIPALAALLVTALAIKLTVVFQLKDHILLQPATTLDTGAYYALAVKVLGGDLGLGPGLYYVSPLYIYFLAAVYGLSGTLAAVRVAQVLLGTITIGLIFITASAWFGRRVAWLSAITVTLTGLLTFYEAVILQTSIDAFLTAVILWTLTLALRRWAMQWFLLSGIAFGIASLNRPNMLVAAVGVAAVLVIQRRLKPAAFVALGLVAGLAPSVARNAIVAHEWTLVSSHGGLNFDIGNGEGATGLFRPVPGIRPTIEGQSEDTRRVAETALGRPLTDAEVSGYFSTITWQWIASHPTRWAQLLAKKTYYLFNAQHIALPLSYPFYAYDAQTLLRFLPIGPSLLIPVGLVGLVLGVRRTSGLARREYLAWLSFVPAYAVSVVLFFISERYRVPLLLPLAIGVGVTLDALLGYQRRKDTRQIALIGAALVVAAIGANWPLHLPDGDGRGEEQVRMAENLARFGDAAAAESWTARALQRSPQQSLVHYRVGTQLANSGHWDLAESHLETALALDPAAAPVEKALGETLMSAGKYNRAVPHLRRALALGAEGPQTTLELANALAESGDADGARAVLMNAEAGRPVNPGILMQLGARAMSLRLPEIAARFFSRATTLAPADAGAQTELGGALVVLRRYDEAARVLAAAVTLSPQNAEAFANLALSELQLGRVSQAAAHVNEALRIDPRQPLALQLRSTIPRRP